MKRVTVSSGALCSESVIVAPLHSTLQCSRRDSCTGFDGGEGIAKGADSVGWGVGFHSVS